MKQIFLDSHSTTPVDPQVYKAIKPYFTKHYYNASSVHFGGEQVAQDIERAREQVASLINADPDHIFFTNSATESNNIILKSMVDYLGKSQVSPVVITTNTEHSSVVETLKAIDYARITNEKEPISHIELKINENGELDYEMLEKILDKLDEKCIVSIIGASNIIGTIHDLKIIGDLCKKYNAIFHTDAVQGIGRMSINVSTQNIFALACSGHKAYGLKGAGALYVKEPDIVQPIIHGGGQNIISSGTQNVPAIIGMGRAFQILQKNGEKENERMAELRNLLWNNISSSIPDAFINGTMKNRLPHNLCFTIPNVPSEVIIKGSNKIMVSGSSACASGDLKPSSVILALGTPHPECAIRIGVSRFTTKKEIIKASGEIIKIANSVKNKMV